MALSGHPMAWLKQNLGVELQGNEYLWPRVFCACLWLAQPPAFPSVNTHSGRDDSLCILVSPRNVFRDAVPHRCQFLDMVVQGWRDITTSPCFLPLDLSLSSTSPLCPLLHCSRPPVFPCVGPYVLFISRRFLIVVLCLLKWDLTLIPPYSVKDSKPKLDSQSRFGSQIFTGENVLKGSKWTFPLENNWEPSE